MPRIDFEQVAFGQPDWLWLLVVPFLLASLWVWRFVRRRADVRRLAARRTLPITERFGLAGDLPFWLLLPAAVACLIIALARPHGPAAVMRQGGIDLVILLDGSASMRVKDVAGDRWQRSTRFLRLLADSLAWKSDRISLTTLSRSGLRSSRIVPQCLVTRATSCLSLLARSRRACHGTGAPSSRSSIRRRHRARPSCTRCWSTCAAEVDCWSC